MRELKTKMEQIHEGLRLGRLYRHDHKFDLALSEFENILSYVSSERDPFFHNVILNEMEIIKGKTIIESKPRGLAITLTNNCNIKCIMCSVWKNPWNIPEKTINEIIEILPYLERIFWQGGEVFLSPYFEGLLEEISRYPNVRQDINTNGLLINEKWARKLVMSNANIIFSVDGITKQTYENIRRGARFEDLLRNIELFSEYVYDYAMKSTPKKRRCSTIINLVVMKSNYRELEGFVDFAKKYKFDKLQINPVDMDGPENIFLYNDTQAVSFIEKVMPDILRKAKECGVSIFNWLPLSKEPQLPAKNEEGFKEKQLNDIREGVCGREEHRNRLSCYWPWQFLFIDSGGKVRPQCFCKKEVGNVQNNSIKEIWNNQVMQEYRRKLFANDFEEWCEKRCVSGSISKEALGLDG